MGLPLKWRTEEVVFTIQSNKRISTVAISEHKKVSRNWVSNSSSGMFPEMWPLCTGARMCLDITHRHGHGSTPRCSTGSQVAELRKKVIYCTFFKKANANGVCNDTDKLGSFTSLHQPDISALIMRTNIDRALIKHAGGVRATEHQKSAEKLCLFTLNHI